MFRTEITIPPASFDVDHSTRLMTIGSCFSETIGQKLSENRFQIKSNPFGTIFNPISIFKLLAAAIDCRQPGTSGYVQSSGIHQHLDFHSQFGAASKTELASTLDKTVISTHEFLKSADVLIITSGSAMVYEYQKTTEIVANCHKLPQREFRKFMLNTDLIISAFEALLEKLNAFNNQLQIILTVSPVRHIKDTLVANSLSKALLRAACDEIVQKYNNVSYFPSFEIMMDDLRDYRFYKPDMLHPNETAEEYIWNKFVNTYMSHETTTTISEWNKILKAMSHKPFNPTSEAHQKFISETISKLSGFSNKFDVSDELEALKRRLI
ncbi:MAG: GSCFA domain-containing protein [Bacteroidota bacterium]